MYNFHVAYNGEEINGVTNLEAGIQSLDIVSLDQINEKVTFIADNIKNDDTILLSLNGVTYKEYVQLEEMNLNQKITVYMKISPGKRKILPGSFELKICTGFAEKSIITFFDYCVSCDDNISNDSVVIGDTTYDCEIITMQGNQTFTGKNIGSEKQDTETLIIRVKGDFTVSKGSLIYPYVRKRGMILYVEGDLINNGTISMTARGSIGEGADVYLYEKDEVIEIVPAVGGNGASGVLQGHGNNGLPGLKRGTGGGGSGGARGKIYKSGSGSAGTSFSGGSGGGAMNANSSKPMHISGDGENAKPFGGSGGNGVYKYYAFDRMASGGGAGNPGGKGSSFIEGGYKGTDGTGGLLVIYVKGKIINNGIIRANGEKGGDTERKDSLFVYNSCGGSSGGGSINIFYGTEYQNNGIVEAVGGERSTKGWNYGGAGGSGTVTIMQL